MKAAWIQFQGQLEELLYHHRGESLQPIEFQGSQTIKHLVESLGIPHTEVGLLRQDDSPIDFAYQLGDGETVQVFPATCHLDLLSGMFLDGKMTLPARFILDNHLGKLASYLRMLGFDADYGNDYQDDELAEKAVSLERILLTRDRQLLMRKVIRFGYLIRSLEPEQQAIEVLERFDLYPQVNLFKRCMRCNHPLQPVEKREIVHRLQPLTKKYFHEFHICTGCQQVYWQGSHIERMQNRLAEILPPETYSQVVSRQQRNKQSEIFPRKSEIE